MCLRIINASALSVANIVVAKWEPDSISIVKIERLIKI